MRKILFFLFLFIWAGHVDVFAGNPDSTKNANKIARFNKKIDSYRSKIAELKSGNDTDNANKIAGYNAKIDEYNKKIADLKAQSNSTKTVSRDINDGASQNDQQSVNADTSKHLPHYIAKRSNFLTDKTRKDKRHKSYIDRHHRTVTVLTKDVTPIKITDTLVENNGNNSPDTVFSRTIYPIDSIVYSKDKIHSDDTVFKSELVHMVKYDYINRFKEVKTSYSFPAAINKAAYTDKIVNKNKTLMPPPEQHVDDTIFKHHLTDELWPAHRHERIQEWDKYRLRQKAHLYLAFNYMPSYSREIVVIKSQDNSLNSAATYRSNNEHGIYGGISSAAIGITFGSSNTVYASYLYSEQGVKALGHTIDLGSGMTAPAQNNNIYRLYSTGFGIGYNHIGYNTAYTHLVHSVFDIGLYRLDVQNKINAPNQTLWSGKTGLGVSIHPRYSIEFQAIPTIFWNFTNIGNQSLDTKLFNLGVTFGVAFRPHWSQSMYCN